MNLATPRRQRRMSLTPMIDVVFLLLVFFMLAARFGGETVVPVEVGAGGGAYEGPPRLVEIYPDQVRLNGLPVEAGTLAEELSRLMDTSGDAVVLRSREGASVQTVLDVMQRLGEAGFETLVLVE